MSLIPTEACKGNLDVQDSNYRPRQTVAETPAGTICGPWVLVIFPNIFKQRNRMS